LSRKFSYPTYQIIISHFFLTLYAFAAGPLQVEADGLQADFQFVRDALEFPARGPQFDGAPPPLGECRLLGAGF
jgi:hypothetical protein